MKNIFKRTMLCVLALAMTASALAGCGAKKEESEDTINVQFYSTTKETDEASYNIYTQRYSEFEEYWKTAYPDEKPLNIDLNYYERLPHPFDAPDRA